MSETGLKGIGKVDQDGEFMMYNRHLMKEFFADWKNRTFTYEFKLVDTNISTRLNAFFWAECIPKLRKGFRDTGETLDEKETYEKIKRLLPVMRVYDGLKRVEDKTGSYIFRDITDDDWTNQDWNELIRQTTQFAAEHLHTVINDPQIQVA